VLGARSCSEREVLIHRCTLKPDQNLGFTSLVAYGLAGQYLVIPHLAHDDVSGLWLALSAFFDIHEVHHAGQNDKKMLTWTGFEPVQLTLPGNSDNREAFDRLNLAP
jgi:hypothetical protein